MRRRRRTTKLRFGGLFGGPFGGRFGVRVLVADFGRGARNPPHNYGLVACLGGGPFGGRFGVRVPVTDFIALSHA